VLIPYDIPQDEFTQILDNLQGVIFTGGVIELFDNNGPTLFLQRVKHVLDFASSKNDEGIYYPVMSTCLGFQAMTIALSGMNPLLLTCDFGDENRFHSVTPGQSYSKARFWKLMDQDLVDTAFKTGNLYYSHNCGFHPEVILSSSAFNQNMNLLATSMTDYHKTFAALVEHKKYPFIGQQFHPEKTLFDKYETSWLPRDPVTKKFTSEIIFTLVDQVRKYAVEFDKVPSFVQKYMEPFLDSMRPPYDFFQEVYLFPMHVDISSQ